MKYCSKFRPAELFFPPRCPICGNVIARSEVLCPDCNEFETKEPIFKNIAGEQTSKCVSLFFYKDQVQSAVCRFKFYGFRAAARGFGALLANALKSFTDEEFVVTFVPMIKSQEQERGYNQAKLLAKEVALQLNCPCSQLLKKTKKTMTQHKLNRTQRRKNVKNSYKAIKNVQGKNILLCDDIVTTGETLRECARILYRAGAKTVICATIAVVGY